jgi:hypothetical protein
MIILSNTTDKIQVVLGATVVSAQMQCYASFRDTDEGTTLVPGRGVINTNNTTPVDLIGAPGAGIQRGIDLISVVNTDTGPGQVSVLYNANSTTYTLAKFTLAVGEKIEYTGANGWRVFANSGAVKQSINQGSSPVSSDLNRAVLANDVTNNNAVANTIQDVTGLSFPVVSGSIYYFKFFIKYTSASTATGSRWAVNGPTFSDLTVRSVYSLTSTTQTVNTVTAYDTPSAVSANSGTTAGNWAIIEGFITPTANGDVIARFASEVQNSAIVAKAGSFVEYIQLV